MRISLPFQRLSAALLTAIAIPACALAQQQRPLTGNMLGTAAGAAPGTPAPAQTQASRLDSTDAVATPPAADGDERIGASTRELLRLQASGTQAGKRLPILGDQASASYARYLKSFDHPIPEFFENKVKDSKSN